MVSEAEQKSLESIAGVLNLQLTEVQPPKAGKLPDPDTNIDGAKKELEDLYNLM